MRFRTRFHRPPNSADIIPDLVPASSFVPAGSSAAWKPVGDLAPVLTGTVTDEEGEPLRGLYVKAMQAGTLVGWSETDCNGRYEIPVPFGAYEVKFCSRAYHELAEPHVVVKRHFTNLDAVLVPFI